MEFEGFLKKLGIKLDEEQIEEVFEFFDHDKDYRISCEEFKETIYGKVQIDIEALKKRLRRHLFKEKIDLFTEMQIHDRRNDGFIDFNGFLTVIKKNSDLSQAEIEVLYKNESSNNPKSNKI